MKALLPAYTWRGAGGCNQVVSSYTFRASFLLQARNASLARLLAANAAARDVALPSVARGGGRHKTFRHCGHSGLEGTGGSRFGAAWVCDTGRLTAPSAINRHFAFIYHNKTALWRKDVGDRFNMPLVLPRTKDAWFGRTRRVALRCRGFSLACGPRQRGRFFSAALYSCRLPALPSAVLPYLRYAERRGRAFENAVKLTCLAVRSTLVARHRAPRCCCRALHLRMGDATPCSFLRPAPSPYNDLLSFDAFLRSRWHYSPFGT